MTRIIRFSLYSAGITLFCGLLLLGDRYFAMVRSVPLIDGTLSIEGLDSPVEIVRDEHGIPHIFGQTTDDALFALGLAHAQDRLWQMEFTRRLGQGRLSEIMGQSTTEIDLFFRTLNFPHYVAESWKEIESPYREMLIAYSNGVNAIIQDKSRNLPPEFLILFHRPEPWRPEDSLLIIKMMSIGLSMNMNLEISRARLVARLGLDKGAEFFPSYPSEPPLQLPEGAFQYPYEVSGPGLDGLTNQSGLSNNWVVNGRHTATGLPLLANDPHLELNVPSIWYLAHLALPETDIIGATIAGFPSVILGRNDRIAWGFTNTGADVQDLYIEQLNPDDDNQYLTPGGFADFKKRVEFIKVRFGRDLSVTLDETRHGPVLPKNWQGSSAILRKDQVLALKWTAFDPNDTTAVAGLDIMDGKDWSDVLSALEAYRLPMQNIVFADIDGNIGFIAPARVPVRHPNNRAEGQLPVPGWNQIYDWKGFVPFDELPMQFNPSSGVIVTANQKIVADDFPHMITRDWELPLREKHIRKLLESSVQHTVSSFREIQLDNVSPIADRFLAALLTTPINSERGRWAGDLLSRWNGAMDIDLPEPLIFAAWLRELTRATFADELGPEFLRHWSYRPSFMEQVLTPNTPEARWCDNIATPQQESCDALIDESLEKALISLEDEFGSDRAKWRWGDAHFSFHAHNPFSAIPILSDLFTLKEPSPGGFYTINRGGHWFANESPFANVHGSGYRAIYDMSSFEDSEFIQSTGQSGNIFSPFYDNLLKKWAEGQYIKMNIDYEALKKSAAGTLILVPVP